MQQDLAANYFVNLNPESLLHYGARGDYASRYISEVVMTPERIDIELTKSHPIWSMLNNSAFQ